MGKRELLLVLGFAVVGWVVYQLTASPDRGQGTRRSFGQLIQSVRREIQGNPARIERRTDTTEPLGADIDEVRIEGVSTVTLLGEDRADLALELTVVSTGINEAVAGSLADATVPRVDVSGRLVTLSIEYPDAGRQTASLIVRVPARLRARIRRARAIRVSGLAAADFADSRGDVVLEHIAGPVEGDHVGGNVRITRAGDVTLTARSAHVRLEEVSDTANLELTGGTLRAARLTGEFELRGRSVDAEIERPGAPARIEMTGGRVVLRGASHEVQFDGSSTDLVLALEAPAPVTAIANGGSIRLVAPPTGGFTLDALATDQPVRLSGIDVAVSRVGDGERAAGHIAGGGPIVALRSHNGSLEVSSPAVDR
jgi:hypothetical protein